MQPRLFVSIALGISTATGAAAAQAPAASEPASASASEAAPSEPANPFANHYREGPGLFAVGLHSGSYHRDGLGAALGFVPWSYTELEVSYAYRTQHSIASVFKFNILPRALICPYLPLGYVVHIATLPQGIRLFTHQMVAGVGVQARVASRFVIGAEVVGNGALAQVLRDKRDSHSLSPSELFTVTGGFRAGVHLP